MINQAKLFYLLIMGNIFHIIFDNNICIHLFIMSEMKYIIKWGGTEFKVRFNSASDNSDLETELLLRLYFVTK